MSSKRRFSLLTHLGPSPPIRGHEGVASERTVYRTLETPGTSRLCDAQAALDSAVRAAYGMKDDEDTLALILRLNLDLADREAKGQRIAPPGSPVTFRAIVLVVIWPPHALHPGILAASGCCLRANL
jgi:hypothetical protein